MKGVQSTVTGFRAYVRVKGFPLQTKRFKRGTAADTMKDWRDRTRARLILDREEKVAEEPPPEGFRADVARYLPTVSALASYANRARDLRAWIDVFGDTPTQSVTNIQIQTMRDQWLTIGPRWVQRKGHRVLIALPLSASAVNHRLSALSNLLTVLYPALPNPVKLVDDADEGQGVPRSTTYDVLRLVLETMADRGQAKKGELREVFSAAKIRAGCLAWSGLTPKELGRVTATDNRFKEQLVVVTARRKGRGAPGRVVPLTKEGQEAFRQLHDYRLYGPFNVGVVNRALALACETLKVPKVTCYTFRHSFITGVVRATNNLRLGGLLAGHVDDRSTRRYRLAAEMDVMQDGIAQFGKANKATARKKQDRSRAVFAVPSEVTASAQSGNFRRSKVGRSGLPAVAKKRKNA